MSCQVILVNNFVNNVCRLIIVTTYFVPYIHVYIVKICGHRPLTNKYFEFEFAYQFLITQMAYNIKIEHTTNL